jgi:hypothetical protein
VWRMPPNSSALVKGFKAILKNCKPSGDRGGMKLYGVTAERVVHDQNENRPDDGDKNTIKIHSGYARMAYRSEDPTTDHSTDNPKHHIQKDALTPLVDDLTGDETGD